MKQYNKQTNKQNNYTTPSRHLHLQRTLSARAPGVAALALPRGLVTPVREGMGGGVGGARLGDGVARGGMVRGAGGVDACRAGAPTGLA